MGQVKALAVVLPLRATGVPPPLSCLVTDALDRPERRSEHRRNALKANPLPVRISHLRRRPAGTAGSAAADITKHL
jgi:hypothetical protein